MEKYLMSPISSILKRATRKVGDRLNIITFMCHERYQPYLCNINADFYSFPGKDVRPSWNTRYSPIPSNYHFVDRLRDDVVPDLVLAQNVLAHIPLGIQFSKQYHIPLVTVFHTDSVWQTPDGYSKNKEFFNQSDWNIFISDYARIAWGFKDRGNCSVIYHMVDTELFSPGDRQDNIVLSVCNDYVNRSNELGFDLWKYMTNGLPVRVIGDTPGLSKPSESLEDLVKVYKSSKIYLNTSIRSPIPCAVLEAASCGLGLVTTNTNSLPDIFTHGHDCLMFSPQDPQRGRKYLEKLLSDPRECERLGKNARETVLKRFGMDRFVSEWEFVLENVCEKPYLG